MNEENNFSTDSIMSPVENEIKPTKSKKSGTNKIFLTVNILTLIGLIVLYVLFFTETKQPQNTATKAIDKITYAFVNSDTILAQYDFVLDAEVDLAKYEKILQNQYTTALSSFQKEYDDYIKRASAGLLTLDQQKKTEEKLSAKQQSLSEMEQKLALQLQAEKLKRNMEVHDTIVSHIMRYNKSRDYTFIFEKSYGGGLLYANPQLDITSDILKGLNEEYETYIKSKKADDAETEENTKNN